MRVIYSTLKLFFYSLVIIFLLLASILFFLTGTTPGLRASLKLAGQFVPGKLVVTSVKGRIFNHIVIKELLYSDKNLNLKIDNLDLSWHLPDLLHHQLTVNQLQATDVKMTLRASTSLKPNETQSKQVINLPQLPLALMIRNTTITTLMLKQDNSIHKLENLHLQAYLTNEQWQFNDLSFVFNNHTIYTEALVKPVMPYPITASVQIKPQHLTSPSLEGKIKVTGNLFHYYLNGQLTAPTSLTLKGDLINGSQIQLLSHWRQLKWPINDQYQLKSETGQLNITGTLPNLSIALEGQIKEPLPSTLKVQAYTNGADGKANALLSSASGEVNFDVTYDSKQLPKLKGNLKAHLTDADNKLTFPIKQFQAETQFSGESLPTLSLFSKLTGYYNKNLVTIVIHYSKQALNAVADLSSNHLEIKGHALFPWSLTASIPQPNLLHTSLAGVNTTLTAKAELLNEQKGDLHLFISKGVFKTPELSNLTFEGGNLVATLDKQALQATGNLSLDQSKKIYLTLNLPHFNYFKGNLKQQEVKANLTLAINSLAFLNDLNSMVTHLQGQLGANLNIAGTLSKPSLDGEIKLTNAAMSIPSMGTVLSSAQLALLSHNQKWQLNGEVFSEGIPLAIKGDGEFSPTLKGMVNLKGQQFPLITSKEYLVNVSPDLSFEFTPSDLKLRGRILIPKATIKPQTFSESVSLTDDVVFAKQKETPNPFNLDMDIKIEMGEKVILAVKGLQGYLIGAINIKQVPKGPLTANGELNVKEGKYQAYGQNLTIEKGQLLFTGGLINDPAIRVRAIRQFNNTADNVASSNHLFDFNSSNIQTLDFGKKTTVGVELAGRLSHPKVDLFSVPATLSQADILSMLLLGRPANQADKSGAQLLLAAVSALNLSSSHGGTQLLSQLKQNLGIDFNLENNIQYNQKTNESTDSTSLVVGKSLSKRLYLSYNIGLSKADNKADNNVLTLKYLLNKFFSVQVNASTSGSGIDIFYTHQKD